MLLELCKVHHLFQLVLIVANCVVPGCSDNHNLMKEIKDEIKKLPDTARKEISSMRHGEFHLL